MGLGLSPEEPQHLMLRHAKKLGKEAWYQESQAKETFKERVASLCSVARKSSNKRYSCKCPLDFSAWRSLSDLAETPFCWVWSKQWGAGWNTCRKWGYGVSEYRQLFCEICCKRRQWTFFCFSFLRWERLSEKLKKKYLGTPFHPSPSLRLPKIPMGQNSWMANI